MSKNIKVKDKVFLVGCLHYQLTVTCRVLVIQFSKLIQVDLSISILIGQHLSTKVKDSITIHKAITILKSQVNLKKRFK